MGFKINDIVHPDGRLAAQEFECAVCLCIVDEPMQTSCDHVFCQDCMSSKLACPICRSPLGDGDKKLLKECNKPMMRMLHNLKVWCPYHKEGPTAADASAAQSVNVQRPNDSPEAEARAAKRLRLDPGETCGWEGSYVDLLSKHLSECKLHVVPCPQGCGEMLRRKDLASHGLNCAKSFEACSICKALVRPNDMALHRKDNAELHVQLLEARLREKEAEQEAKASVEHRMIDIAQSMESLATEDDINEGFKNVQRRFDIVEKKLSKVAAANFMTARWRILNFQQAVRTTPRGQSISSRYLYLCGMDGFWIDLFPNGDSKAQPGTCSLFLLGPATARVSATLAIHPVGGTSKERRLRSLDVLRKGKGWPSFMATPQEDEVMVVVELHELEQFLETKF